MTHKLPSAVTEVLEDMQVHKLEAIESIQRCIETFEEPRIRNAAQSVLSEMIATIQEAENIEQLRAALKNRRYIQEATMIITTLRDRNRGGTFQFTSLRLILNEQLSKLPSEIEGQDVEEGDLEAAELNIAQLAMKVLVQQGHNFDSLIDDYVIHNYESLQAADADVDELQRHAEVAFELIQEFMTAVLTSNEEVDLKRFFPLELSTMKGFVENIDALCPKLDATRDYSNVESLPFQKAEKFVSKIRRAMLDILDPSYEVNTLSSAVEQSATEIIQEATEEDSLPAEEEASESPQQDSFLQSPQVEELSSLNPIQKLNLLVAEIARADREHGVRLRVGFASKMILTAKQLIEDDSLSNKAKDAIAILVEPICDHARITPNPTEGKTFGLGAYISPVDFEKVIDQFAEILSENKSELATAEIDREKAIIMNHKLSNFRTANMMQHDDSDRYEVTLIKALRDKLTEVTLRLAKGSKEISKAYVDALIALGEFILANLHVVRRSETLISLNAAPHKGSLPNRMRDTLREVVAPAPQTGVLELISKNVTAITRLLEQDTGEERITVLNLELQKLEQDLIETQALIGGLEDQMNETHQLKAQFELLDTDHHNLLKEAVQKKKELRSRANVLLMALTGVEPARRFEVLEDVRQLTTKELDLDNSIDQLQEKIERNQQSFTKIKKRLSEMESMLTKLLATKQHKSTQVSRKKDEIAQLERTVSAKRAQMAMAKSRLSSLLAEVDGQLDAARSILEQ